MENNIKSENSNDNVENNSSKNNNSLILEIERKLTFDPSRDFNNGDESPLRKSHEFNFLEKISEKKKRTASIIGITSTPYFTKSNDSSSQYRKLLDNNKEWVQEMKDIDLEYFDKLAGPQYPIYLIITCADSRITLNETIKVKPGECFITRNIGNMVMSTDISVQSVVQYAVEVLKVKHILVMGHTDCGACKASLSNDYHGLVDFWLKQIREVAERNREKIDYYQKHNPEKVASVLSECNVKEQVLNLCKSPLIQKAWASGQELFIHGCMFDLKTGLIKDLNVMQSEWKEIEDIYKLEFSSNLIL